MPMPMPPPTLDPRLKGCPTPKSPSRFTLGRRHPFWILKGCPGPKLNPRCATTGISTGMAHFPFPNPKIQTLKPQVHYDYNFHRNDLFLEERILRELSTGLRSDVAMYIHKRFLDKVPFFAGRDRNFLSQLVMKLKPLHFRSKQVRDNLEFLAHPLCVDAHTSTPPHTHTSGRHILTWLIFSFLLQIIYESGDTGRGMYFIAKGRSVSPRSTTAPCTSQHPSFDLFMGTCIHLQSLDRGFERARSRPLPRIRFVDPRTAPIHYCAVR